MDNDIAAGRQTVKESTSSDSAIVQAARRCSQQLTQEYEEMSRDLDRIGAALLAKLKNAEIAN